MAARRFPLTRTWSWSLIKEELQARDVTLASVARELRISGPAVTKVKRIPSRRVQDAIAKKLGLPPHEIWPDRYSIAERPLRAPRSAA